MRLKISSISTFLSLISDKEPLFNQNNNKKTLKTKNVLPEWLWKATKDSKNQTNTNIAIYSLILQTTWIR